MHTLRETVYNRQDDVYDDGFKKKTVGEGFSMCLFEETHSQ